MPACVLCPICQTRYPHRPAVCDLDRSRLAGWLREIPDLYAVLPAALAPSVGGDGPKVSGSRETPLPLRVDVLDLTLPAGEGVIHDPNRDQSGIAPVTTILDQWVRWWAEWRSKGERLPAPTVPVLAGWLLARMDDACDSGPAMADFAREIQGLVFAMRAALNISRRSMKLPAPCPDCELLSLVRGSGNDYVECRNCGRLWTDEEYQRLTAVMAARHAV